MSFNYPYTCPKIDKNITEFKDQLYQKDSDHKVEIASLKANATAAQERITFLTAELAQARAQVEADRTARVEIAKAEAQRQGVVVNANGK